MEKKVSHSKLKISIVGAESSGKTTLCHDLAEAFNGKVVNEYARTYLNENGLEYQQKDLLEIAKGQTQLEEAVAEKSSILIADTNLLSIVVWSYIKYGTCDERIVAENEKIYYDIILLTDYNIPWKNDPMRESPDIKQRKKIHELFIDLLEEAKVNYHMVTGNREERLKLSLKIVKDFIQSSS